MSFRLAAPSCVIPDRVGPNCRALAPLVREVGLMLLETRGCQDYDDRDLPPDLPDLGLSYHAHLPVDLPWKSGPDAVCGPLRAIEQKIAFLHPCGYVLHPPPPGELTRLVRRRPDLASSLRMENTRDSDLRDIWPEIESLDLGVCLDVGHLVSYGQERIMQIPGFLERVRMLHVYGGESGRGHAALEDLPDPGLLRAILGSVRRDCVLVAELFRLDALTRSLDLLRAWLDAWGMDHD